MIGLDFGVSVPKSEQCPAMHRVRCASASTNLTPPLHRVALLVVRRLEGVSYKVMADPEDIRGFINGEVRSEWENDIRERGGDPGRSAWLKSLAGRKWELKIIDPKDVKLSQRIVEYVDLKMGYNFRKRLVERTEELKRAMVERNATIWPLVLRGEDLRLMDGYCRYHALVDLGVSEIYAYIGRLWSSAHVGLHEGSLRLTNLHGKPSWLWGLNSK